MASITHAYNSALQKLHNEIRKSVGHALNCVRIASLHELHRKAFVRASRRTISGGAHAPGASLSMLHIDSAQPSEGEDLSVHIRVLPGPGLSPVIGEKLANVETKRAQEEKAFFEKVR